MDQLGQIASRLRIAFKSEPENQPQLALKPGDIIGFSGRGLLSAAINIGTYGIPSWSISHVGIVAEYRGELLLFESTILCDLPCKIKGMKIDGTQAHEIMPRVNAYDGRVWHYPLFRPLYECEQKRLTEFLTENLWHTYDDRGAIRAAGVWLSWLKARLSYDDLRSIFCSELCAAAHSYIGIFPCGDNAGRWSPNLLVRTERRARILFQPRRLK
jgi:hypothetical protein